MDYLEVLTKQSTFVLRLGGGTLFSYPFLWGCEYC
nr:MAG TPA: Spike glycoprotein E1, Spike glycoprotein enveloped virus, Icosahedral virus.0A [Caudoviricetes sp.]